MLGQFKSHIWCHCEYSSSVLFLAVPSQRVRVDQVQERYLRELGITEEDAFLNYNFAPLGLRRGFALLGFLHKRVLGACHPAVCEALPFSSDVFRTHDKALDTKASEVSSYVPLFRRSIYHYVAVYNVLPQEIVDMQTVSGFQSQLTCIAKDRVRSGHAGWKTTLLSVFDCVRIFQYNVQAISLSLSGLMPEPGL